ncbi:MAG: hypothetical protein J6C57_06115 [Paludibacteraceae bacterium]|jgi:hypothetical protein|nr:hypothetical protein [Paludibacteraceae bacterium]
MEDYSWIGTLVGTLATTAGGITETVISGKNKRTEIEAGANIEQTTKSQNSKTVRTLIIGGVVLGAIVLFGLFVWSNRRK